MDYTYIFWMGGLFGGGMGALGWSLTSKFAEDVIGFVGMLFGLILIGVAGIMFTASFQECDIKSEEAREAEAVKVYDTIILKARGFPTQMVDDIKCLEHDVKVVKTIKVNKWGGSETISYSYTLGED